MTKLKVRPVQNTSKTTAENSKVSVKPSTSQVSVATKVEQGPPGPRGNDGGISTLEQATDFDGTAKTNGSVIEFNQTSGNYEAATPIADRQIHGGYF